MFRIDFYIVKINFGMVDKRISKITKMISIIENLLTQTCENQFNTCLLIIND